MKSNNVSKAGLVLVILSVLLIIGTLSFIWQSTKQLFGLPPSPGMMRIAHFDTNTAQTTMGMAGGEAGVAVMPTTDMMYAKGEVTAYPAPMPPVYPQPGATPDDRAKVGQKIIQTGSLMLRVDDAAKQLDALKQLTQQMGGFVASANLTDNGGVKTAYATLRIPTDKFQDTIAQAKKLATLVLSEQENGDDVTAQYVDLDARLKAAQAEEQQYLQILKQAKTIEDTLAVTERLGEVRARIEEMQGQMRLLTDQTSYATLTVTLTEDTRVEVPTRTWAPLETFRAAFRALVVSLQGLADALIAAAVFLVGLVLPVFVVLGFIAWILFRIWKRWMK